MRRRHGDGDEKKGRRRKVGEEFRIQNFRYRSLNDSVQGCERIATALLVTLWSIIFVSSRRVQHNRMFCHVIIS